MSSLLIFPLSYIEFLTHFHGDRDFFECHEVLEDHWKKNGMKKHSVWVGLIQIAVSFYHYRRGNRIGAVKMMKKALEILDKNRTEIYSLGISHDQLMPMLIRCCHEMQTGSSYKPISFPILDSELLTVCKERVHSLGLVWGGDDELDEFIINKHIARRDFDKSRFETVKV
ncbi:DUF309 domain-containing protein [Bacillus norwichensis]|uniref:DUF309 domain-containing protein n=1 Tax=Bacillus norwichensis TaxID=2762217 RepID=UPI00296E5BA9|nr:DUF309 domain-containing protein [Bacillus norwichensis]